MIFFVVGLEHEDPAAVELGHPDVAGRILADAARDRRAHAGAGPVELAVEAALVVEDVDVAAAGIRHVDVVGREHRVDRDVGRDLHLPVVAALAVAVAGMLGIGAGGLAGVHLADRLQPLAVVVELDEAGAALVGHPQRRLAARVEIGGIGLDVVGGRDAAAEAAQRVLGDRADQLAVGRVAPDPVVPVVADQDRVVGRVPVHAVGVEPGRPAEPDRLLELDEAGARGVSSRVAGGDRVVGAADGGLHADLVRARDGGVVGDQLRLCGGGHGTHLHAVGVGQEQRQLGRRVVPVERDVDGAGRNHGDRVRPELGAGHRHRVGEGAVECGRERARRRYQPQHRDGQNGHRPAHEPAARSVLSQSGALPTRGEPTGRPAPTTPARVYDA